jgi:tRNA-2-methylthio-N6-dimethylallyladenosine synthase
VRPGTKAEQYTDDVPAEEKNRRLDALLSLQDEIATARYSDSVGSIVNVLVEGVSKRDDNAFTGRTVYGRIVNFTSDAIIKAGDEVEVLVTEAKRNSLFGRLQKML